mgnify:CR=1 FL=1
MSKFNPNMTKQEIVNIFSEDSPNLLNLSTENAYRAIVSKYPQYKVNSEKNVYKQPSKKESNIWDSMPNFIKAGYNNSLQGMAQEMATGNKRFDLKDYDPGVLEDLGAGIASFFAPADFALTAATGGIGAFLGKSAGQSLVKKYVFKKLAQNGASKKIAAQSANKAVDYMVKAGSSASALGVYSGASDALQQKINEGSIDIGKSVSTGLKGALLGGMTGGTNAFLTQKGAGILKKTAAETVAFGVGAPALEGELPTPQDFLHAAGMVAGIKGVNHLAGKGFNKLKQYAEESTAPEFKYETIPKTVAGRDEIYRTASQIEGAKSLAREKVEKVWVNSKGERGTIVAEDGKTIQFKPFDAKDTKKIPRSIFANRYKSVDNINLVMKDVRSSRMSDIRNLEKQLNYGKKVKETNRAMLAMKGKQKSDASLSNLNNDSLIKYRDKLKLELKTKEALNNFEKVGIRVVKPRASLLIDKILPEKVNKLFDVIRPAKNQGSVDPVRRAYIALADDFVTSNRRVLSSAHDLMQRAGFVSKNPTDEMVSNLSKTLNMNKASVRKNYWELLSDAVESGLDNPEIASYKNITNYLFNTAKQSGVEVPGYIVNYIPRILKPEVAETMFSDIASLGNRISKSPKSRISQEIIPQQDIQDLLYQASSNLEGFIKKRGSEARFLNKAIKKSMETNNEKTNIGLRSFLEEGGELAYFKAMTKLSRALHGDMFRLDGNLEKKRLVNLPKEFYERDVRNILGTYSNNVSRRSAEVKHFGTKGELAQQLIKSAKSNQDKDIMGELHAHIMGTISYKKDYNFNPNIKNFLNKVVEWETATKIGLGTASAMNLSQFAISSALSAGYWRFARGAYKYATDKKFRRQVDASGADLFKYVNEMLELSPQSSFTKKLAIKLTDISQFNRINSYNNILAASSARVFIDDLIAVVSGNRKIYNPGQLGSKKWARGTLQKMGIDPNEIKKGKISETSMLDALGKFAIDTQLQRNILSDPLVLNRPTWKPFLQFKSFGYRQYNFIKNTLEQDALNYNFMPMLRLAGAGFATGAISLKAKEKMKSFFSGEETYDPAKFLNDADTKDIIDNIAAIGAFGFLGDFLTTSLEEGKTMSGALRFFATPAFMSDIDAFLNDFLPALERDYKNYQGDFIKRAPARAFKYLGSPLVRDVSKRIEPKGLKNKRIKSLRGRRKAIILDKIIKSKTPEDYKKIIEDVKDWNRAYPNYPILVTDINNKEVYKRKMRLYKNKKDI